MVDLENLTEEALDQYKARFAEMAARSRRKDHEDTEPVDLPHVEEKGSMVGADDCRSPVTSSGIFGLGGFDETERANGT